MRGDCSIRTGGLGFTPGEIAACAQQQGLLSIEIELSAACQCACANCVSKSPQPVLSPQEVMGVIEQAKKMGARRVILVDSDTGPYPQLRQIIEAIEMEVELFAGDTEITGEFAKFLFNRRVGVAVERSSMDESVLVLDRLRGAGYCREMGWGAPPEDRGEGSLFESLACESARTSNAQLTADRQRESQYTDPPKLAARIFADAVNLDQIPTIWRWARSEGIEPHLQIITPRNGADHPLRLLAPNRAKKLFEDLGQIDQQEFGRTWDIPPALIGRSCKRHLFAAHVTACGNIFACVGVTIPLGNVRTEPLSDILKLSEVIEDIRAFSDKVKEPCRTCSQTADCYGCRGAAYQLTGDYLAGDQQCWKAESVPIESLPVSVEKIIPHGPSIRMVDQLVQLNERRATTSFTIPSDSLWVDANGRLDEVAYIEIIAQSFASSHGFHLTAEQRRAHRGLLLGITNVTISGCAKAGDRLLIEIHKITRFGGFGIVVGEVRHRDGRLIATGQVKVWRPSEETAKAFVS